MTSFFKNRRIWLPVLVLLCAALLVAGLRTGGFMTPQVAASNPDPYGTEVLFKYKTPYVGDSSKVVSLIDNLPYAGFRKAVSLQTKAAPYGIDVNYDFSDASADLWPVEATFRASAAILFALIENADVVAYHVEGAAGQNEYRYSRDAVQADFDVDLQEYATDLKTFEAFLKDLALLYRPELPKPQTLEEAVGQAVKSRSAGYAPGEVATEGHVILDSEEKDGTVKVYTISSYGAYGFENGIFTFVSGSGAIPTVMTFTRDEAGGYSLLEYKEPMDGEGYSRSIKEMFPESMWDRVLGTAYPEISQQQEKQAAEYLTSIGRQAEVSSAHVEKQLADIDVGASNKLFTEFTKYDGELNTFPYWLGTKEQVEDGVRYIYETSQDKTEDGFDLIIFRKMTEDGTVVKEYRYKIVGSEPQLLE